MSYKNCARAALGLSKIQKSARLVFIINLLAVAFLALSSAAFAESKENECAKVLKPGDAAPATAATPDAKVSLAAYLNAFAETGETDTDSLVAGEQQSLEEFVLNNKSPMNFMNAAQRMLAIVLSAGKSKVRLPLTGEEVEYYPFFSSGLPITQGFRIIENEKVIAEFVNNLRSQARGDRAGVSPLLLVGGAGSGKSEFLKLLSLGAEKVTSSPDSQYAVMTFKWTNLAKIPALRIYLPTVEVDGKKTYADIDAPLSDSPYTLLPPAVQKLVLKDKFKAVQDLIGMDPAPFAEPDPGSQFIRNEIIQYYAKEKGEPLNAKEVTEALNKHVVLKRDILSRKYGRMPLIEAQGNDIDIQGLFMSPNPVVKFGAGKGSTHPMSWFLTGKLILSHGNVLSLDEFLRNKEEFRNMLLGMFESRVLSIGGAPTVPLDAVMIAASNTASLNEVLDEGKNSSQNKANGGTSAAAINRFKVFPMRWSILPTSAAKILLYSKEKELYQQSLVEENAPVTKANLDQLVPRSETLDKMSSPDYRYRMWFGQGADKVEVAPHTMMMMAEIVVASRLITNPAEAAKVVSGKIIESTLFRNPIDRIRLYEGLKPEIQPDELRELNEVTALLKTGESGISARDANRWLEASVTAARADRAGHTLTPGIVLKVFREMLTTGQLPTSSNRERVTWLGHADEVVSQLLIPRLDSDISRALANGDRVVNDAYFDIIEEMFAIHQNANATSYYSETGGQEKPIDRERLKKVSELFKKQNGRPLDISQIAIFHSRQRAVGGAGRVPEESLLGAVSGYYAELMTQVAGFSSLVEFQKTGSGSDEVKAAHSSLVTALRRMGYNEVAIRDAMMLISEKKSRSQQGK